MIKFILLHTKNNKVTNKATKTSKAKTQLTAFLKKIEQRFKECQG